MQLKKAQPRLIAAVVENLPTPMTASAVDNKKVAKRMTGLIAYVIFI
jgi:hypothetical protein